AAAITGRTYRLQDEVGFKYIHIQPDGRATAGEGPGRIDEPGATWTIRDGNLCLKGSVWWKNKGNCHQFFGGASLDQATHLKPTWVANGPNAYYPVIFLD